MNKKESIALLAKKTDLTQEQVEKVYDALGELIVEITSNDDRFEFNKVGTFKTVFTKARESHNPRTGEKMQLPASKRLAFKAAPTFKQKLRAVTTVLPEVKNGN